MENCPARLLPQANIATRASRDEEGEPVQLWAGVIHMRASQDSCKIGERDPRLLSSQSDEADGPVIPGDGFTSRNCHDQSGRESGRASPSGGSDEQKAAADAPESRARRVGDAARAVE